MTKNLVKVSQCGSCVLTKLACAAWRFLSRLSALKKRGSCDNKSQSHEEPGRDTTADSPLRTRDPRDFAARFHQTEKPNRQATQAMSKWEMLGHQNCQIKIVW